MSKILVTGGCGFIGQNLVRYLLQHTDHEIHVLDRLGEAADRSAIPQHPRVKFVHWDLRSSLANCRYLAPDYQYVAHLAAGSHVDRSIRDPIGFLQDNVMGTANLLEWARTLDGLEKFLYFSTDEVFGPAPEGVTYDEYSPHTPNNPYAASKAAAEALIPAWANQWSMPLVVSHCTNVAGPGQDDEKFIPLVTKKVMRGDLVQIHARDGVPSSRYYVDVDDVSAAVLTILEHGGIWGGPGTGKYNISGSTEYSNLEVAQRIAHLLGKPLRYELVDFVPNRPRHDQRYAIQSTRLEALGWRPIVGLDQTLQRYLDWAKANR